MLTFTEEHHSTTVENIEKLEHEFNLNFPITYKNHLLKHNGGTCTPSTFYFKERRRRLFGIGFKMVKTDSCINYFFAINGDEYDDLNDAIHIYKTDQKRLPNHILPIADDPGGNLICISCGAKDYGKIYFWDHENEIDYTKYDDYNYTNLHLIAHDLDSFLASLVFSND
jgi:cell wall assembly regulator SMI1